MCIFYVLVDELGNLLPDCEVQFVEISGDLSLLHLKKVVAAENKLPSYAQEAFFFLFLFFLFLFLFFFFLSFFKGDIFFFF